MPERPVAHVRVLFRRTVECPACGCAYGPSRPHPVEVQGVTEDEARERAGRIARRKWGREGVPGPCPGCGLYPAGVVGRGRLLRHGVALGGSVLAFGGLLGVALLPDLGKSDGMAIAGAVLAALVAGAHAVLALWDRNTLPARNRARAGEAVADRKLVVERDAEPVRTPVASAGVLVRVVLAGVVAAGAAGLAVTAPVYRVVNGWPYQPQVSPGVCGPGDEVRLTFDHRIRAINHHWRGNPTATVEYTVAGETRRAPAAARSLKATWDPFSISTKRRDQRTSPTLWAKVVIPADVPAGATVRISVDMTVTYPSMAGDKVFDNEEARVHRTVEVQVASAGAGRTYEVLFYGGLVAGFGLVVLLGLGLAAAGYLASRVVPRVTLTAVPG